MKSMLLFLVFVAMSGLAQVSDLQISEPIQKLIPPFFDFYGINSVKQDLDKDVCIVTGKCLVRPNQTIYKGDGDDEIKKGTAIEVPVKLTFHRGEGAFYKFTSIEDSFLAYTNQKPKVDPLSPTPSINAKSSLDPQPPVIPQPVAAFASDTKSSSEERDIRAILIKMSQPGKIYQGVCGDYNGSNRVVLWFTKCDNDGLKIEADMHLEDNRTRKITLAGNVRVNSKIKAGFEIFLQPTQAPLHVSKDPNSNILSRMLLLSLVLDNTDGFIGKVGKGSSLQMSDTDLENPRVMLSPRR
jgi:hypothetical protein